MQALKDDPELAQELVQLLYKKLQQRRQELRELRAASCSGQHQGDVVLVDSTAIQSENETLRVELSALEHRLSAISNGQETIPSTSRENAGDLREAIHEACREMQGREAIENETIQDIRTRLQRYKDKYDVLTVEMTNLSNTGLSPLVAQLNLMTAQLEDDNRLITQSESRIEGAGSDRSLLFDHRTFQAQSPTVSEFPRVSEVKAFLKSQAFSKLPKGMLKTFKHLKILALKREEVCWCKNGIERGVHLAPSFCYDITSHNGTRGRASWIKNQLIEDLQDDEKCQWEVVYHWKNNWYYYGTYMCAGRSSVSSSLAKDFDAAMVKYAVDQNLLHEEQVPPAIAAFVTELYSSGPLTLDLVGLERIGYNRKFSEALVKNQKAMAQMSSASSKAPPPRSEGVRGKKRPGSGGDGGNSVGKKKKHKHKAA